MRTIRALASRIGPREASSAAYRQAADWVQGRFEAVGYDVRRQRLHVPAGNSWGIEVPAGRTWNVVATPPGFDPSAPHLVVGAHLDTVPQAPGAEDDASGISVILELARLAGQARTRLPVELVAFAAEEPRGDGDALHHFGSTAMVARMAAGERRAVTAMVALDRVGVGTVVPVCIGGIEPPVVRTALLRVGAQIGVPTSSCLNTSADHWSFEKAGIPAARVGGTSYTAYHSVADVPSVVSLAQLNRVGRLMWAWVRRQSGEVGG
jgi:Zn-dependent M28 family amino/carboxypeptidase